MNYLKAAVWVFAETWSDDLLISSVGPSLTENEAEALAHLLDLAGDDWAASEWRRVVRESEAEAEAHLLEVVGEDLDANEQQQAVRASEGGE